MPRESRERKTVGNGSPASALARTLLARSILAPSFLDRGFLHGVVAAWGQVRAIAQQPLFRGGLRHPERVCHLLVRQPARIADRPQGRPRLARDVDPTSFHEGETSLPLRTSRVRGNSISPSSTRSLASLSVSG